MSFGGCDLHYKYNVVDEVLFDRVLLAHSFSGAGAAQLLADIRAVRRVLSGFVDASVPEMAMRHVSEGASLVGLPIKGHKVSDAGIIMLTHDI